MGPIVSTDPIDGVLDPVSDWNHVQSTSHSAQFYDDDEFLLQQLTDFVGGALGSGDSALVLATAEHRAELDERLVELGMDVQRLRASGRFVSLDAASVLEQCDINGRLSVIRFRESIEPLIVKTLTASRKARPHVAVFGELVALLQLQGRLDEALDLEDVGNDLCREFDVSVLCAYPMNGFLGEADTAALRAICHVHSHVYPAESYTSLDQADQRLRAITELQQKAQALQTEIEQRKRVQQLLARREAELAEFLENALEGIQQIDPDGRIEWANYAMLELLGRSREDCFGCTWKSMFIDPSTYDDIWSRLEGRQDVYDVPAELRFSDGSSRHLLLHARASWDGDQMLHVRCFVRDVTERHRIEQALEERNAELRSALAARDEFLSVAAHELKTPVTGVRGFAQLLLRDLKRERDIPMRRLWTALETIEAETTKLTQLVTRLLDASEARTGQLTVTPVQTDLAAMLRRFVDRQASLVVHRLQYEGPEHLLAMVDPDRIEQVVSNLTENAVRFSPRGGEITLSLERAADETIRLAVTDSGIGIPKEQRARLFNPFQQTDAHRHLSGLGVGLYLASEIVARHGGRIELEDPEGGGTRFVVILPV